MAIAASGYAKHVYRNNIMARYKLTRRCRHSKDEGDLVTVDASRRVREQPDASSRTPETSIA